MKVDQVGGYTKFDDVAARKIGFYVYALQDPTTGIVFYVGKGVKNRWYDHIASARKAVSGEKSDKLDKIREIESKGQCVKVWIVRHGLKSEEVAFEVEAAVAHALKIVTFTSAFKGAVDLTNLVETHHPERGLISVSRAQSLYNARRAPKITVPCVLVKVSKLWTPEMSDSEVMEATVGWWPFRKNAVNAKYAFAISRGTIRGIYKIASIRDRRKPDRDWQDDIGKRARWGFPDGCEPALDLWDLYIDTSVKHLFKLGEASSVKLLNCD
jgi:hypothetical protein